MSHNKKYNIVLLNHHASAPDVGGGGRHYELAVELSKMGHKVTVIASSTRRKKYYNSQEVAVTRYNDNFKFVWLKTKPEYTNNVLRFLNYIDYMLKAGRYSGFDERPNVVIASSVHPLAWVAGYKLSKRYNAKFIVEVRDLWPLSLYEDISGICRKVVFSFFEALEKKYYTVSDAIVTTAPYAYEYMEEKFNINRDKVFHIPHGLDIEVFDKNARLDDDILDDELNKLLENNFCITYTGSLSRSEGLPTLVQAAKYLKDIDNMKIIIVGSGSERPKLERIIKDDNLDNVVMVGRQPKNTIPLILKKSDMLFCGLMERKAFKYGISKNKFYDYMASKKPIIFASSVRDSLIDKAKAGITIKPHEPKNLADTIRYLYNNIDTLGKQFGQNGREYVEKYHTVGKITSSFLKVIDYTYRNDNQLNS